MTKKIDWRYTLSMGTCAAAGSFLILTIAGIVSERFIEKSRPIPEPVVKRLQPVDYCYGWEEGDSQESIQLKIDLCRASLALNKELYRYTKRQQELVDEAHDEFDLD